MRLPLINKRYVTLFSVYAPTLRTDAVEKDKFYSELRNCLQSLPLDDKVIILSILEWAKIHGKEFLTDTALVTATTTGACCWSFAQSSNLSSPT